MFKVLLWLFEWEETRRTCHIWYCLFNCKVKTNYIDCSDRAIFDSTLTTPTAGSCKNADPGAYQCIGPEFFESYGAFPQGTIYSHNFNLATWNSSGFATLRSTVPLACNALRGQLDTFEMGNEPDLFIGKRRDSDYDMQEYLSDWFNATGRMEDYLREACPDMAKKLRYTFPSVSSPGSRLRIPQILHSHRRRNKGRVAGLGSQLHGRRYSARRDPAENADEPHSRCKGYKWPRLIC